MKPHILDWTFPELKENFQKQTGGQPEIPSYRIEQICKWIFESRVRSFEGMTNLPASLRQELAQRFLVRSLQVDSKEKSKQDPTVKFHFKTHDNQTFSAVFLPHGVYNSLCISTQVGCAWECQFCASGLVPFFRNLSSGEILDQVFWAEESGKKIRNVLFMGMGEPLANYPGTIKAIRWLTSPQGFKMNPSRIVLSTTGLAPQILKIADENLKVNLALSLHAATDFQRRKIMPKSAKFPLKEVLSACKVYQRKNDSELTMEYILLRGVNDSSNDAHALMKLLRSFNFSPLPKVNIIPYNPVPSLKFNPPTPENVQTFFEILKKNRFTVHTRKPQGQDLQAACGQLSA